MADYYPIETGQTITPTLWNSLVEAIQNGSIFSDASFIGEQVATLGSRVTALEDRVTVLEGYQARQTKREQKVLTAGQSTITLANPPLIDSELLIINTCVMAKTGIPTGFVGDYSLPAGSSTITLNSQLAMQIVDGDLAVIVYEYEV